ncbi:Ubiquitin carboxyl-terminal hydrolase 6 [Cyphellophora attinorum]|uniref:Ubiquitin carboxyl-terminal hydrolase n=1 Tax=Cyphellophora attinorum TaxID=1664694 RepID=A0A0N1H785_9EURO|nr:Ubiquitin carboxyl-terminal hydrolase 6 [Phialophora attinorum]KPI42242.1 Ubiquitin carboxyl-terminal hydrolase 6 [Phialophora attinorum]
MATIPIIVQHQGKKYDIDLDTSGDAETFKFQIFSLTGVEPDNQSVLIPRGKLKSDTNLAALNLKPKQLIRVLGSPSGEASALVAPAEKPKFLEDMTEAEMARMEGATPAGLVNLGNTCYLNSTIQILRAMPELRSELEDYKPASGGSSGPSLQSLSQYGLGGLQGDMTSRLRDLLNNLADTQKGFEPIMFLNAFRTAYPQFAQKDKTGRGYAQQDAEEAWTQILQQVKQTTKGMGGKAGFVDRFLTGSIHTTTTPPAEVGDNEPAVEANETFDKLRCSIDPTVNHLSEGLEKGLVDELEKRSDTLGRDAIYTKKSQLSRLPAYLTVQFVRFFWKNDIKKKAKILKKVTFPEELDVVDMCTPELRKKLIPVRDQVRNFRKDEQDMERARKRQKVRHKQEEDRKHDAALAAEAAPIAKLREQKEKKENKDKGKEEERGGDLDAYKTDAEYEAEKEEALRKARKALYEAIDPELAADETANKSGLYELTGVITHQGASADSGHYTAYVKKEGKIVDDPKAPGGKRTESDGKWWWFNDDKVSEVPGDIVQTLSGGGESHSALILLYKAIPLPSKEDVEA